MNPVSDRQLDAFDNPAKSARRDGNLRVLRKAAYLLWADGERTRLRCDWWHRLAACVCQTRRRNPIHSRASAVQNLFNLFAVGEMDWRSGRIDGQLPGEVSSELPLVSEQQLFELANVTK